jgi:hypothetical protein
VVFGASLLTSSAHPAKGHAPLTPTSVSTNVVVTKENKMPFKAIGLELLDAVINVRLTCTEKAKLKEDADLASLSMSELIRRRYFGRPIIANADAIMLKELRRIGGLLKHIHNQSDGIYSKDTAAALVALKEYIGKLSRDR